MKRTVLACILAFLAVPLGNVIAGGAAEPRTPGGPSEPAADVHKGAELTKEQKEARDAGPPGLLKKGKMDAAASGPDACVVARKEFAKRMDARGAPAAPADTKNKDFMAWCQSLPTEAQVCLNPEFATARQCDAVLRTLPEEKTRSLEKIIGGGK